MSLSCSAVGAGGVSAVSVPANAIVAGGTTDAIVVGRLIAEVVKNGVLGGAAMSGAIGDPAALA